MKRLSPRELLLVSAPLVVVGLGIWGARLREERWPTKPRITCRVRPATPLEMSQGATAGVTVEATAPTASTKVCVPSLMYSLLREDQGIGTGKVAVWDETHKNHNEFRGSYLHMEQNHAYNWSDASPSRVAHAAEVSLKSDCNAFPIVKQRFELSTKNLPQPNFVAARRTNFRVTKATNKSSPLSHSVNIELEVQDVMDESQGLITGAQTVRQWVWQDKKQHIFRYSGVTETATSSQKPGILTIRLRFNALGFGSPAQGTKIRGLLSVEYGWPQEIELEVPGVLAMDAESRELKFSTKLAPLPPSARN